VTLTETGVNLYGKNMTMLNLP